MAGMSNSPTLVICHREEPLLIPGLEDQIIF